MSSFSLQLAAFAQKAKGNEDEVVRKVILDFDAAVRERSPVGKRELWAVNIDRAKRGLPPVPAGYVGGRFRANWQLGMDGQVPGGELYEASPPASSFPEANDTDTAPLNVLPAEAAGHRYTYINNLPYAQALEDGHSTQSPPGAMIALTVQEFQQFVDAAVQGLNK